jgi:hypothetical protein
MGANVACDCARFPMNVRSSSLVGWASRRVCDHRPPSSGSRSVGRPSRWPSGARPKAHRVVRKTTLKRRLALGEDHGHDRHAHPVGQAFVGDCEATFPPPTTAGRSSPMPTLRRSWALRPPPGTGRRSRRSANSRAPDARSDSIPLTRRRHRTAGPRTRGGSGGRRYSSPSRGGSRRGMGEALISEVVVSP